MSLTPGTAAGRLQWRCRWLGWVLRMPSKVRADVLHARPSPICALCYRSSASRPWAHSCLDGEDIIPSTACTQVASPLRLLPFACFKVVSCWAACTIVKLMHVKGCLASKAAAHFSVLLDSGLSVGNGAAATPRLPARCEIRGCRARTRRRVACHAGPWARFPPRQHGLTALPRYAARKWGAAKPSCSCLSVGLWLEPGTKARLAK